MVDLKRSNEGEAGYRERGERSAWWDALPLFVAWDVLCFSKIYSGMTAGGS